MYDLQTVWQQREASVMRSVSEATRRVELVVQKLYLAIHVIVNDNNT